jgi:hypothetical protein
VKHVSSKARLKELRKTTKKSKYSDVEFWPKFEPSTSQMYAKSIDSVNNTEHQMDNELEKQFGIF